MNNVLAMKTEKEQNQNIATFQSPALIINFEEKRAIHIEKKIKQALANDGVKALRLMIAEYEVLMNQLALQITPEQLAEYTSLNANQQISEDLRRLNTLVDALEYIVNDKVGYTLADALEIMKKHGDEEMVQVIEYLENSEYPIFVSMLKAVEFVSGKNQKVIEEEVSQLVKKLEEIGAFDSVNAIQYLEVGEFIQ